MAMMQQVNGENGEINLSDVQGGIELEAVSEDGAVLLTRRQAAALIAKLAVMLADPEVG